MNIALSVPVVLAVVAFISALVTVEIWIGSVNADRKNFKEFMDEIRKDIKEIFARLPSSAVTKNSPDTSTK